MKKIVLILMLVIIVFTGCELFNSVDKTDLSFSVDLSELKSRAESADNNAKFRILAFLAEPSLRFVDVNDATVNLKTKDAFINTLNNTTTDKETAKKFLQNPKTKILLKEQLIGSPGESAGNDNSEKPTTKKVSFNFSKIPAGKRFEAHIYVTLEQESDQLVLLAYGISKESSVDPGSFTNVNINLEHCEINVRDRGLESSFDISPDLIKNPVNNYFWGQVKKEFSLIANVPEAVEDTIIQGAKPIYKWKRFVANDNEKKDKIDFWLENIPALDILYSESEDNEVYSDNSEKLSFTEESPGLYFFVCEVSLKNPLNYDATEKIIYSEVCAIYVSPVVDFDGNSTGNSIYSPTTSGYDWKTNAGVTLSLSDDIDFPANFSPAGHVLFISDLSNTERKLSIKHDLNFMDKDNPLFAGFSNIHLSFDKKITILSGKIGFADGTYATENQIKPWSFYSDDGQYNFNFYALNKLTTHENKVANIIFTVEDGNGSLWEDNLPPMVVKCFDSSVAQANKDKFGFEYEEYEEYEGEVRSTVSLCTYDELTRVEQNALESEYPQGGEPYKTSLYPKYDINTTLTQNVTKLLQGSEASFKIESADGIDTAGYRYDWKVTYYVTGGGENIDILTGDNSISADERSVSNNKLTLKPSLSEDFGEKDEYTTGKNWPGMDSDGGLYDVICKMTKKGNEEVYANFRTSVQILKTVSLDLEEHDDLKAALETAKDLYEEKLQINKPNASFDGFQAAVLRGRWSINEETTLGESDYDLLYALKLESDAKLELSGSSILRIEAEDALFVPKGERCIILPWGSLAGDNRVVFSTTNDSSTYNAKYHDGTVVTNFAASCILDERTDDPGFYMFDAEQDAKLYKKINDFAINGDEVTALSGASYYNGHIFHNYYKESSSSEKFFTLFQYASGYAIYDVADIIANPSSAIIYGSVDNGESCIDIYAINENTLFYLYKNATNNSLTLKIKSAEISVNEDNEDITLYESPFAVMPNDENEYVLIMADGLNVKLMKIVEDDDGYTIKELLKTINLSTESAFLNLGTEELDSFSVTDIAVVNDTIALLCRQYLAENMYGSSPLRSRGALVLINNATATTPIVQVIGLSSNNVAPKESFAGPVRFLLAAYGRLVIADDGFACILRRKEDEESDENPSHFRNRNRVVEYDLNGELIKSTNVEATLFSEQNASSSYYYKMD